MSDCCHWEITESIDMLMASIYLEWSWVWGLHVIRAQDRVLSNGWCQHYTLYTHSLHGQHTTPTTEPRAVLYRGPLHWKQQHGEGSPSLPDGCASAIPPLPAASPGGVRITWQTFPCNRTPKKQRTPITERSPRSCLPLTSPSQSPCPSLTPRCACVQGALLFHTLFFYSSTSFMHGDRRRSGCAEVIKTPCTIPKSVNLHLIWLVSKPLLYFFTL